MKGHNVIQKDGITPVRDSTFQYSINLLKTIKLRKTA